MLGGLEESDCLHLQTESVGIGQVALERTDLQQQRSAHLQGWSMLPPRSISRRRQEVRDLAVVALQLLVIGVNLRGECCCCIDAADVSRMKRIIAFVEQNDRLHASNVAHVSL